MKFLLYCLTTVVFTAAITLAANEHRAVLKSLRTVKHECRQYLLNDNSSECLSRCQAILTRDWNDTSNSLAPVFDRFYQPVPEDCCNAIRTQRCLAAISTTTRESDRCQRAASSIRCYKDHYGQLIADQPKFVATPMLLQNQIFAQCAEMLGYSADQVQRMVLDESSDPLAIKRLHRCFLLRSGVYRDLRGLDFERMYVQCGGYDKEFYRNATQCQERLMGDQRHNQTTLPYSLVAECIGNQYATYNFRDVHFYGPVVILMAGNSINNANINQS